MPTFRGVTVNVYGEDGHLEEWGIQFFPRANTVSCYIQSETDMRFAIELTPQIPFDRSNYECLKDDRPGGKAKRARDAAAFNASPPDFQLLASLYLDGREKSERRAIVVLDQNHNDFSRPNGKVFIKSAWVEGRDGKVYQRSWYFREPGVETLFDKLLISKGGVLPERFDTRAEENLIAAMENMSFESDQAGDEIMAEGARPGEIVVELKRVTLGSSWKEPHYRPKLLDPDETDLVADRDTDLSHTTAHGPRREVPATNVPVVHYTPFEEGEKPFAKFRFFYRSGEKLRAFNFPNFQPRGGDVAKIDRLSKARDLKVDVSSLTSLESLSSPNGPRSSSRSTQETVKRAGERAEDAALSESWDHFSQSGQYGTTGLTIRARSLIDQPHVAENSRVSLGKRITREDESTGTMSKMRKHTAVDSVNIEPTFNNVQTHVGGEQQNAMNLGPFSGTVPNQSLSSRGHAAETMAEDEDDTIAI